jgi:hypothetical protein
LTERDDLLRAYTVQIGVFGCVQIGHEQLNHHQVY